MSSEKTQAVIITGEIKTREAEARAEGAARMGLTH